MSQGSPPPPPETWRAVESKVVQSLRCTKPHPHPTSPSQEHRAREAHASRETDFRLAGRKEGGDLTAHIPDQTGLSSAGRKGGHAGEEEEERKKHILITKASAAP